MKEAFEHHYPFKVSHNYVAREDIARSSTDVDIQPTKHIMENQVGYKEAAPQGTILMYLFLFPCFIG
jgi:hypothetical protein